MPILPNAKQERYCNEYHIDLNRILAIFRTGCWPKLDPKYPKDREKASTIAAKFHTSPFVLARIQELEDERNMQCNLHASRIKSNLFRIADFLNSATGDDKELATELLKTMTIKDILSANDKLMKHLGEYEKDNVQKADAAMEMLKRIQDQEDVLPSQAKDRDDERSRNAEIDRAET